MFVPLQHTRAHLQGSRTDGATTRTLSIRSPHPEIPPAAVRPKPETSILNPGKPPYPWSPITTYLKSAAYEHACWNPDPPAVSDPRKPT
jgi:hypothetical protein